MKKQCKNANFLTDHMKANLCVRINRSCKECADARRREVRLITSIIASFQTQCLLELKLPIHIRFLTVSSLNHKHTHRYRTSQILLLTMLMLVLPMPQLCIGCLNACSKISYHTETAANGTHFSMDDSMLENA